MKKLKSLTSSWPKAVVLMFSSQLLRPQNSTKTAVVMDLNDLHLKVQSVRKLTFESHSQLVKN